MTNLTITIKHFASLNRAPGATWTDATKRKAPHKPLLLLAVLDLVHRGVITTPFIAVTGHPPLGWPRTVLMALGWGINLAVAEWAIRRRPMGAPMPRRADGPARVQQPA